MAKKVFRDIRAFFTSTATSSLLPEILKIVISAMIGFALSYLLVDIRFFLLGLFAFFIFTGFLVVLRYRRENQFDVLVFLKEEARKEHWVEVLRLGYPMSRPLWLSGRHKLRVEIGEILKDAATNVEKESIKIGNETLKPVKILASACIDDLGWTRYILGDSAKAIDSIKYGIKKAEDAGYDSLAIKGYRHLCGIFDELNDDEGAKEAKKEIARLLYAMGKKGIDSHEIAEIRVGLTFSEAESCARRKDFGLAIEKINDCKDAYHGMGDYERYVKTFDLKARVFLEKHDYGNAELVIEEGIAAARNWERHERLISLINLFFLTKYASIEKDLKYSSSDYNSDKHILEKLHREAKELVAVTGQEGVAKEMKHNYKALRRIMEKSRKD
jgi:hypothetical protein